MIDIKKSQNDAITSTTVIVGRRSRRGNPLWHAESFHFLLIFTLFLILCLTSCAQALNGKIFPNPQGDCGTLHWEYDSKSGELILSGEMTSDCSLKGENGFASHFPVAIVEKINVEECDVKEIPSRQFSGYVNVEQFTVPASVTYVGEGAFDEWGKGQTITLGWNSDDKTERYWFELENVLNSEHYEGGLAAIKIEYSDGEVINEPETNHKNEFKGDCQVTLENGVLTIKGTEYTEIRMIFNVDFYYDEAIDYWENYYTGNIDIQFNINHYPAWNDYHYSDFGEYNNLAINGYDLKEIKFTGPIKTLKVMESNYSFANATLPYLEKVTFNDGLEHIEEFPNFNDLDSITIPSSVTQIDEPLFGNWDDDQRDDRIIYLDWNKDDTTERDINILVKSKVKILYKDGTPYEGRLSYEDYNGITYYLTSDGTLVMSGDGEIILYQGKINDAVHEMTGVWNFAAKKLLFEGNITKLSKSDNSSNYDIESIILPETLQEIGDSCFKWWENVKEITIPASVTKIAENAFSYWDSEQKIILDWNADDVTERDLAGLSYGDSYDGNKAKIVYKDGIPYTGYVLSYRNGTGQLTVKGNNSVSISQNEIHNYISNELGYSDYKVKSIIFTGNITKLQCYGLSEFIQLESVTLPEGLQEIGDSSFYNCNSLSEITIPSSVTTIGYSAFGSCTSIESLVIPSSVTSIGSYAFEYWTSLQEVILDWSSEDTTERNFYYYWLYDCNADVHYNDDVPAEGKIVVYDADSKKMTILSSDEVSLSSSDIEVYSDIQTLEFKGPITKISINNEAKTYLTNVTTVILPNKLNELVSSCFADFTNLTNITLPSSVTKIGQEVFTDCTSIESLVIPSSVTSIGSYCFDGWNNTQTITLDWNSGEWTSRYFDTDWTSDCSARIVYKDGSMYN